MKIFNKYTDTSTYNIVLPTNELHDFNIEFIGSNRVPRECDINKLEVSIKLNNALHLKAIIAYYDEKTNTLWLIDGQHRYMAAKALGLPIHVKVTDTYDPMWMSVLNCNQRNWTLKDFANMYMQDSDPKVSYIYSKFIDFMAQYNISAGLLVALFQNQTDRDMANGGNYKFKTGALTSEHLVHVQKRLSQLESLTHIAANPTITLRTLKKQQFQQAMLKALETKDFSLEKFKANLYGSRNKFNDLAKQSGMSIEIFRIERKK
tara:strand:- start:14 stop:799 length:786 start_codon:yes stop_codon:yes gene_type:complete